MDPDRGHELLAVPAARPENARGPRPTDPRCMSAAGAPPPNRFGRHDAGRHACPGRQFRSGSAALIGANVPRPHTPFLSQPRKHPSDLLRGCCATHWTNFVNSLAPVWFLPARTLVRGRGSAMRIEGVAWKATCFHHRSRSRPAELPGCGFPQPEDPPARLATPPLLTPIPPMMGEHRGPARVSIVEGAAGMRAQRGGATRSQRRCRCRYPEFHRSAPARMPPDNRPKQQTDRATSA